MIGSTNSQAKQYVAILKKSLTKLIQHFSWSPGVTNDERTHDRLLSEMRSRMPDLTYKVCYTKSNN